MDFYAFLMICLDIGMFIKSVKLNKCKRGVSCDMMIVLFDMQDETFREMIV